MGRLMRKKGKLLTPKRITASQRRARRINIKKARAAQSDPRSPSSVKRSNAELFRSIKKMRKAGLSKKDMAHLINTEGFGKIRKLGKK